MTTGECENQDNNGPIGSEAEDDKLAKKSLVIEIIAKKCVESQHEIFQKINKVIQNDNSCDLDATILSGGITNYSYKVFVDKYPELCVFAKLSFEYALWNPDTHHDLQRTTNEFNITKTMSHHKPNYVVVPLACWNIHYKNQKSTLLVTEWSHGGDEQFGNQFADGSVDPRIAPQIADCLATLHCMTNYDPNFNETVKPCMVNLLNFVKHKVEEKVSSENLQPKDRTEAYYQEIGCDKLLKVLQANIDNFHQRDCLIHSDSHVFNILVEAKPSIEALDDFGPNGSVVLCDWEMTMAGPIGRDIGVAIAGPIGCLIGHMLNGNRESSIDKYVDTLLDCYLTKMKNDGQKTPQEMDAMFRNIVGWCGWCQFVVFYCLGVQMGAFGVESKELQNYVRDTMGVLGLKMMHLSYDTEHVAASANLKELRSLFQRLVDGEVSTAQTDFISRQHRQQKPQQRRKSSIFRASNRRLSDASMHHLSVEGLSREFSINL